MKLTHPGALGKKDEYLICNILKMKNFSKDLSMGYQKSIQKEHKSSEFRTLVFQFRK